MSFGAPVTHVYNPPKYARNPHEAYLVKYGRGHKPTLLLGMNPGPFGMVQTGVPFGDVASVRDFLGIEAPVDRPDGEHPSRPVLGFACPRSEVSGRRLWGFARARFGTAERFFTSAFVWNYCPLAFMEESGKNRTPDKLPREEQGPLFSACDRALVRLVDLMTPRWVIGIGAFAERRARAALGDGPFRIGSIPHPSPASPLANRGWGELARKKLADLGVELGEQAARSPGTAS